MEKGKPVSSLQGAPSYMASPGDEPLMKGKGHYGKMK